MRSGDTVADRYRLDEMVGSGGMGVVWRALDEKLKRMVALKRPHSVTGANERGRLKDEAQIAAQLNHPNAIRVFDVPDKDDRWLVMEYFASTNLADILAEQRRLTPEQVARIGAQIASALAAAHDRGIVHRDVKPGNVLVSENGTAKLSDFGISVWREVTLTSSGRISGTAGYLSPEVAGGRPATPASDVFSLGATLFAAIEGDPPFGTGDPEAVLARARESRFPPLQHAGPLAPVLSELLDHDPKKRPTADQAQRMLVEVAGDLPTPPPPEPPKTVRTGRFRRRRAALAIAGTVVLLVAGVLAVPALRPWGAAHNSGGAPSPLPPTVGAPQQPPSLFGDPHTADPCTLAVPAALRPFGETELDNDYGNFNRCDVIVKVGGDEVDVRIQFATAQTARVVQPGAFNVERQPVSDGECDRKVLATNEIDVDVDVKQQSEKITADLCAMADTATDSAIAVLRRGEIARRSPPPAATSLANADACGLLDGGQLSRIPGVDAMRPEIGFGNWQCQWDSTTGPTSLLLRFDHGQPLNAKDGQPTKIAGRAAAVIANDYADDTCQVKVAHSQYTDQDGHRAFEFLLVVVFGKQPQKVNCAMATDIAKDAVPKLPAA